MAQIGKYSYNCARQRSSESVWNSEAFESQKRSMDRAGAEKDCEAGQGMKIFLYKRAESICLSKNQSLWWDMFSLCVIRKARKKDKHGWRKTVYSKGVCRHKHSLITSVSGLWEVVLNHWRKATILVLNQGKQGQIELCGMASHNERLPDPEDLPLQPLNKDTHTPVASTWYFS